MSAIVDNSNPHFDSVSELLTKQKAAARNASRRKGEQPNDIKPRVASIKEYELVALRNKLKGMPMGSMLAITVIGHPYPPSIVSLESLKKLMIKDLLLETNHRGGYLLLRFISQATRMSAVMNLVEDESGIVLPLCLYLQEPEDMRSAESILPKHSVCIVKEPYFKLGAGGQYAIRVDHPTDIVRLSEDDPRIPSKWSGAGSNPADYWKKKGNDFVGQGNFYRAIEMYSRGLRSSPTSDEEIILHNNRAFANIRIGAFDAALDDVSFVPNLSERSERGLNRTQQALYGLGDFEGALKVLQILVRKFPDNAAYKKDLNRAQRRVEEQKIANYDFESMYQASEQKPCRLDHATYTGPIEVRESVGRGRGLFTTKAVKYGDLLLCEKAFSYSFAELMNDISPNLSSSSQTSFLIDVPTNKISTGCQADLIRDISNKLEKNPSLAPTFRQLYHGDYNGVADLKNLGNFEAVDTFQVAKTVHLNAFGCPSNSREMVMNPGKYTHNAVKNVCGTTGLWIWASYINHSCVGTCSRAFIGDMQIVRAARDMPAGTELTFPYITRESPASLNKKLSAGWGFECDCPICVDDRATPTTKKQQRQKLLSEFKSASNMTFKMKESLIKQLNNTYRRPASEVPRYDMWDIHFSILKELGQSSNPDADKLLDKTQATFSSLGWEIEGMNTWSPNVPRAIAVRKWGLPHENMVGLWLTLRNVYQCMGVDDLAEQAKEFARKAWMVLVGEDDTFRSG